MEIRARIALEVNKFKTNAKVVGNQFKAMTVSGKSFSRNVDKYINETAKNQRAQANRTEKDERDSYSRRMQAVRKYAKEKSKAELETVRNKGGIKAGTTAGMEIGLVEKKQTAMARMSAKERAKYERGLAKEFKQLEKEKERASRDRLKRQEQLEKTWAKNDKALLKDITKAYRQAEKEKEQAARQRVKQQRSLERTFKNYEKNEQKRYSAWLRANTKQQVADRKAANKQMVADTRASMSKMMETDEFQRGMAALRYALYDVSRRAIAFGTAMGAALGTAVAQSAKFESAFTSVERTTGLVGNKARELKDTLYDMATAIPIAFEDLTQIATLGAQLGIASDAVDEFTETVAKFSAITGISAEQVGLSFGRLAQLLGVPVSEFENLSSAIAFTGVNAVATDQEILRMSESIGAAAANAGLAADETVGLASALASLKVRPEQARGVFIRLFRTLDVAVEQGGEKMEDFAKVVGMTTEAAQDLYRQSPMDFFKQFLYGAQTAGTLNETMAQLGITNVRELDVIQRLSQNMGVLETALADTNEQYLLGTYSSDAYALVVDDLASKIQMMQNAFGELGAELGDILAPAIGFIVDALKNAIGFITALPTPVKVLGLAITALAAGAGLFFGSLAMGIAGLLALKLAFRELKTEVTGAGINIATFRALATSLVPSLTGVGAAAGGAAAGVRSLSLAMRALPFIGLAATAATIVASVIEVGSSSSKAADEVNKLGEAAVSGIGGASEALKAIQADTEAFQELTAAGKDTTGMFKDFNLVLSESEVAAKKEKEALLGLAEAAQNDVSTIGDRVISQGDLKEAREKTTEANENYLQSLLDIEAAEGVGVEVDAAKAFKLGENYVDALARGARSYAKADGETGDFMLDLVRMDQSQLTALEGLGFDYMNIYEQAVVDSAGDGKGAQNYVEALEKEINAIGLDLGNAITLADGETEAEKMANAINRLVDEGRISSEYGTVLQQAFVDSGKKAKDFAKDIRDIPANFDDIAKSADAANSFVLDSAAADEMERASNQVVAGLDAMGKEGESASEILNGMLRETPKNSIEMVQANQKVQDSLRSLGESAITTGGEIYGASEASKQNMDNFLSFMEASTEKAISAGDGVGGAISTMIAGLTQLDNSGVNTDQMFLQLKDTADAMLGEAGADYAELRSQLNQVTDVAGLRSIIVGFYTLRRAAATSKYEALELMSEMQTALDALDGTVEVNVETTPATGKTQTALQKMQESIEKLFRWTNKKIALEETLASFGESLRENGKYFSLYSDRGREGIQSILTVIDDLAVQSGGDLQKMANYLGTFRQALVNAGVPAAGLRYVDKAIADTGKSAQFSAEDVKDFERSMSSLNSEAGKTERALLRMAEAASNFSSSVSDGLSARFALVDAMDDITLAQLDMADAAEQASQQISDLTNNISDNNKQVRDAKQAIEDANAEIGKLAADKNTLEYQLDIALKYGDTLRANELRAQIAGIDEEIAGQRNNITDANQDIADAQAENSRIRQEISDIQTTNTREAIEESRALRDLALKFATLTGNMMANAEEGEDLNDIITEQVEDFKNIATQMGYNSTEVEAMAKLLEEELIVAMEEIPDDIKTEITAETSGAMSSINSFVTNATTRLNSIPRNIVTRHTTIESSVRGISANPTHWSTGGFVQGPGGPRTDSIPAMLSNGEYVIQASAVNRYGVDFFNALNQMSRPPAMVQGAGAAVAGGGNQMVFLSPEDRNLLQQAVNRPVTLYADSTTIATTANEGNKILAQRGLN